MIYFITRWWGSKGIVEMEGEVDEKNFHIHGRASSCFALHVEAFPSREAALERVKALARRKVEALRSQAARVEGTWLRND